MADSSGFQELDIPLAGLPCSSCDGDQALMPCPPCTNRSWHKPLDTASKCPQCEFSLNVRVIPKLCPRNHRAHQDTTDHQTKQLRVYIPLRSKYKHPNGKLAEFETVLLRLSTMKRDRKCWNCDRDGTVCSTNGTGEGPNKDICVACQKYRFNRDRDRPASCKSILDITKEVHRQVRECDTEEGFARCIGTDRPVENSAAELMDDLE